MKNPLVSVIVPNYNHARYLEQRLDTVFNQTYQNIEVIILDDKSTDNSLDVIEKYRNHPKVAQIVVNEQNSGSPFKQWDKGINLANGELIWIAESDDYNELTFLEELIIEWRKHENVVVAFSQYVFFNNQYHYKLKERKTRFFVGKKYICNRLIRYNEIRNASGVLFSRNAYLKISKNYTHFMNAGDLQFWVELLATGDCVKVGKNLTYYRQSNTSVTSTNATKGIVSKEDKLVYDYVASHFSLTRWQKYMLIVKKARQYSNENYYDDEIRKQILELWDIPKGYGFSKWCNFIVWLSGSFERYFGILI